MTNNKNVAARINELDEGIVSSSYRRFRSSVPFSDLLGKTLVEIVGAEEESDAILFVCSDGSAYVMYHEQDCCESVEINDIYGNVKKLIGNPLTKAEVTSSSDDPNLDPDPDDEWGTHTWTFYHLATVKGYVDIRWYGESNGYYSESVDFIKLNTSIHENMISN
jgi:hypothetical protein